MTSIAASCCPSSAFSSDLQQKFQIAMPSFFQMANQNPTGADVGRNICLRSLMDPTP